jgi:hypothetical protein
MKNTDINTTIIESYLRLLNNLSSDIKLDLISKLKKSVNSDMKSKKNAFKKAFGGFTSKKSAEEIINEIHSSRNFNRQIESL